MPDKKQKRDKPGNSKEPSDLLRSLDTPNYQPNIMVERILFTQNLELKDEKHSLDDQRHNLQDENYELKIKLAKLNERSSSEGMISWGRDIVGILLSLSIGLILWTDKDHRTIGIILSIIFSPLFIVLCILSYYCGKRD
jgi:hypothetical protein